jgi:hypothetical protein
MIPDLPDGHYPFFEERFPLGDLQMVEVPSDMQTLFEASAAENGISIIRNAIVELRCTLPDGEAVFAVWWPSDSPHMHFLAPKSKIRGRA